MRLEDDFLSKSLSLLASLKLRWARSLLSLLSRDESFRLFSEEDKEEEDDERLWISFKSSLLE